MRTIQEIFNIAMAEGGYRPVNLHGVPYNRGMCCALKNAWITGLLDFDEYSVAKDEIGDYLEELAGGRLGMPKECYLTVVLKETGMPFDEEAQREIYKDWANRPRRVAL